LKVRGGIGVFDSDAVRRRSHLCTFENNFNATVKPSPVQIPKPLSILSAISCAIL
jgi:hypothetical protein